MSLKMSNQAGGAAKMTTLLHVVDLMKDRTGIASMENSETQLYFDEEHLTTPDEIIKTQMESVIIKRTGQINPFTDVLATHLENHEMIYLNNKE
jgi:cytochrome b involved in lipid metabolism